MPQAKIFTDDLALIQQAAVSNEWDNDRFIGFLKQQDGELIDGLVHQLNDEVSAAIDCTRCGNCCRSLMINAEHEEAAALSVHLGIPLPALKAQCIEESQHGQLVINTIPCIFLANNKCSIYTHRFHECREFPHLHKPNFTRRLFGTFMHYGRCPIIFNVIEELKIALAFT